MRSGIAAALVLTTSILALARQVAPPQPLEKISGTVIRADTRTPLANARIELISDDYVRLPTGHEKVCKPESDSQFSGDRRFANTDVNGKFTFTEIIPGRYYLSADHEGYLRANYGQRGIFSPGTLLRIGPQDEVVLAGENDPPPDVVNNPFSPPRGFTTAPGVNVGTGQRGTRGELPPGLDGNIVQTGQRGGLDRESERIPEGAGAPSAIGTSSGVGLSKNLLQDLTLSMKPAPTIVGLVMDERGASQAAASVQAYQLRYTPMNGRTLKSVRTTLTGEDGSYRLFWLSPGRYVVAAAHTEYNLPPWRSSLTLTPNLPNFDSGLPTIFFPTSATVGDAIAVPLNVGEQPRADIRLRPRERFTVRIHLVVEQLPPNSTLIFIAEGGDLCAAMDYGIRPSRNGTFTIADVPEGRYLAMAMSGRDVISELLPVKVDRDSPTDVRLPIVASTEVRGNILLEMIPPNTDLGQLRVSLVRSGQELSQVATSRVDPSTGRFAIPGIGPGTYYPVVDLPPGVYVQNVSASRFNVDKPEDCDPRIQSPNYAYQDLHGHFDRLQPLRIPAVIPAAASCLYIRVGAGHPLRGYVRDRLGKPADRAFVVAIPKSVWSVEDDRGATPPDRYLTGVTDDAGFFELQGATQEVRAGSQTEAEYRLYAFEDLDPNMIYEPGFARRFESHASFVWRDWIFSIGWTVIKVGLQSHATWSTCGAQDTALARRRCYLTLIPAEETAEIR